METLYLAVIIVRWSKLQRELYKIIDDTINFQIHCVRYPMDSQRGQTDLPRYWITLDGETIFDYPKQFALVGVSGTRSLAGFIRGYPYSTDMLRKK